MSIIISHRLRPFVEQFTAFITHSSRADIAQLIDECRCHMQRVLLINIYINYWFNDSSRNDIPIQTLLTSTHGDLKLHKDHIQFVVACWCYVCELESFGFLVGMLVIMAFKYTLNSLFWQVSCFNTLLFKGCSHCFSTATVHVLTYCVSTYVVLQW